MTDAAAPRSAPEPELELTILMPCLNEALTLPTCIRKARDFLERSGVKGEVLIADNGSTDGSQDIARAEGARVVDVPVRGYGAALQAGIKAAKGRYVIMGDADDSYDFANLDGFVERLRAGDQLVMGNRFRGGIGPGAMPPLHRYLGNPVLTAIGRLFFKTPSRDFHCGLRGFDRDAILGLDLCTDGMEFASEMVVKASLKGLKTAEVPTTLKKDGRDRPPHLRSWRDGWRHLRFLLSYSPRWLYFYPGALLTGIGAILLLALLPRPLELGGSVLDVHTMLGAASLLIVGVQILTFGMLARQFASNVGLLPPSESFERFRAKLSLERVLVVGVALILVAFGCAVGALGMWGAHGFGALDYVVAMRLVIPGATAFILGVHLVFAGFMSSLLDLMLTLRPFQNLRRD